MARKKNDDVEPVSTLRDAARALFLSARDSRNGGGRCNYRGEQITAAEVQSVEHAKEIIRQELERRGVGIPIGRPLVA